MQNLDLRAMKVLLSLFQTRNTYNTATQLSLSQSAVARILAKCRNTMDDPLFVRQANTLMPTPVMLTLATELPALIDRIQYILASQEEFKPANLNGSLCLYMNSQIGLTFGEPLLETLSSRAPKVTWELKEWDGQAIDNLLDGRVVMGVHYYQPDLPAVIAQTRLFQDELVVLANRSHYLHEQQPVGIEQLERSEFVALSSPWQGPETPFFWSGFSPRIRMKTDSITLAMQVATTQPLLLASSAKLISNRPEGLSPLSLDLADEPLPILDVVCANPAEQAEHPLVMWLKSTLYEVVQASERRQAPGLNRVIHDTFG